MPSQHHTNSYFIGFVSDISDKDSTSRLQYLWSQSERKKPLVAIPFVKTHMDRVLATTSEEIFAMLKVRQRHKMKEVRRREEDSC